MYASTGRCLLCFLCVALVFNQSGESARRKCQRGVNKYDHVIKKCRKCKCRKGHEIDMTKMVRYYEEFRALECPPCKKCETGYYSSRSTHYKCITCSTACDSLNRTTLESCSGRRNNVCGVCFSGYYNRYPQLTSFPCKLCSSESKDMRECQIPAFYETGTTNTIMNQPSTTMNLIWSTKKNTIVDSTGDGEDWEIGIKVIMVLFCIAGAGAIVLVVCLLKQSDCFRLNNNSARRNCGPSGNDLLNSFREEPASIELEVDGFHGDILTNEVREKMEGILLHRSDKIIKDISAQIDRDPEPLFQQLNIEQRVKYHIIKHHMENGDPKEYVYTVLNRWVEISSCTRLSVLYDALNKCGFHEHCSKIIANLR